MKTLKTISNLMRICKTLSGFELYILIFLIFLSTLAEAFSIGIIIPIFSNQSEILHKLNSLGIAADVGHLIGIVVISFALKSLFVWIIMNIQNNYSFKIQYLASVKIFSDLCNKDYQIVQANGKDYYSTFFNVDLIHFRDTLLLVILLFSEGAVIIALFLVATYISPFYTVSVSFLLICAAVLFRLTFAQISSAYGQRRIEADRSKNSWIRGFLGSYEVSKIMNLSDFFSRNFSAAAFESSHVGAKQITINQSPRYIFETLIVILIGIVLGFSISNKNDTPNDIVSTSILPLVTLAAIALRVLPSLNRVSGAMQGISFGAPAINTVYSELIKSDDKFEKNSLHQLPSLSKIYSLRINDFSLSIGNNEIINNGSAYFEIGGMNGLIGESGAGKSSFIKAILGLYKTSNGNVYINNQPGDLNKYIEISKVALVPQHSFIVDGSVMDNILVGRRYSVESVNKIRTVIDWVENLPEGFNTRLGETGVQISGGQAQRLIIARALYGEPSFVIMDESTSALDIESQKIILEFIAQYSLDHLVIMITHRKEVLDLCSTVYEISNGAIFKCK
jgi:ABC-type bacteriocin/lantibiotic exporter with double-glycine peptidase domain